MAVDVVHLSCPASQSAEFAALKLSSKLMAPVS